MKLFINDLEIYPVYTLTETCVFARPVHVSEAFYAQYQNVQKEWEIMQKALAELETL